MNRSSSEVNVAATLAASSWKFAFASTVVVQAAMPLTLGPSPC